MAAETSSSSRDASRAPLLDDGHPGAEATVHLGELQRDVTAADDDEMLGQRIEFEDRHVGEVVDIGQPGMSGTTARPPTLRKIRSARRTFRPPTRNVCGSSKRAWPRKTVQPSMESSQLFDTRAVGQHDAVLARLDFRHVHADRSGPDAEFGAATGQLCGVRAGHQCLGRDASGVDAGAADVFALHHRNALPGRCQPPRQWGSGLAGTDDDRVEMLSHR